jgi:hypothetical protein
MEFMEQKYIQGTQESYISQHSWNYSVIWKWNLANVWEVVEWSQNDFIWLIQGVLSADMKNRMWNETL